MGKNNQVLSISLSGPDPEQHRGSLVLEQKPWGGNVGRVSMLAAVEFIGRQLFGDDSGFEEKLNCGVNSQQCNTIVYAYPWPVNLPYRIAATDGQLQGGVLQEHTEVEVLQLSMDNEASTRYPTTQIVSARILGDLVDENGTPVPLPAIHADGDRIRLARKVYGSIQVAYLVHRYEYNLVINSLDPETTPENLFSSIVYAWWSGDGTWIEIHPPPGADENTRGDCGFGGGTSAADGSDPDEDTGWPSAAYADRKITIDYCSGEKITDNVYERYDYD